MSIQSQVIFFGECPFEQKLIKIYLRMGPEGLNLVERNNCNTLTQLAILEQLGSNNLVVDNDLIKIRKKTICQRLHSVF